MNFQMLTNLAECSWKRYCLNKNKREYWNMFLNFSTKWPNIKHPAIHWDFEFEVDSLYKGFEIIIENRIWFIEIESDMTESEFQICMKQLNNFHSATSIVVNFDFDNFRVNVPAFLEYKDYYKWFRTKERLYDYDNDYDNKDTLSPAYDAICQLNSEVLDYLEFTVSYVGEYKSIEDFVQLYYGRKLNRNECKKIWKSLFYLCSAPAQYGGVYIFRPIHKVS